LWQGRALRESGDPLGESVLRLLAGDPVAAGDYYALRAAALLDDPEKQRPFVPISAGPPDWDAIAALIAASTALDAPTAPAEVPVAPPSLDVAAELEAVGLRGHADRLRSEAIAGASTDPLALLALVRRFYDDRDASYAARAATALLPFAGEGDEPARFELLRLAYPQPYADLVVDASTENGLDILLLYALIRQESLYDPDAGSVAGALGLTQVIPPTGEAIASALGVEGFEPGDLFRPAVSLRFGANYLASQTGAFEGTVHHALAAYNGGPGASDDAIAAADDDVDLFVESLEFDETRLYVRRVLEHYAQYRYIYAGLDRPSLPR
jgi:soluble lytic murein transglycosylase